MTEFTIKFKPFAKNDRPKDLTIKAVAFAIGPSQTYEFYGSGAPNWTVKVSIPKENVLYITATSV